MYPKEEINKFKGDLKTSIQSWVEGKIDALCDGKPKMKAASVYLKRGLNNYLSREDLRINRAVDNALLFITDENGAIDTDVVVEDVVEMFKNMERQEKRIGMFRLEYGQGEIKITIPDNPFMDMIFGNLGMVRITADDLLELKELLK